jgi:hypothetical protein
MNHHKFWLAVVFTLGLYALYWYLNHQQELEAELEHAPNVNATFSSENERGAANIQPHSTVPGMHQTHVTSTPPRQRDTFHIRQGDEFIRGIRNGGTSVPFPVRFWCAPAYDTSAVIGEKRYIYTATADFTVFDVNLDSTHSLMNILGPSFKCDLELFAFSSSQPNEKTILDAVQAVCVQHNIKGLHRVQGDGPVFIFFSETVQHMLSAARY